MALAFSKSSGSAKKKLEDERKVIIEESWSYFLLKSMFWSAAILSRYQPVQLENDVFFFGRKNGSELRCDWTMMLNFVQPIFGMGIPSMKMEICWQVSHEPTGTWVNSAGVQTSTGDSKHHCHGAADRARTQAAALHRYT